MEEQGWRPQWERSAEVNKVVFPASASALYHTVTGLQGWETAEGSRAERDGSSTETSRRTQAMNGESSSRLEKNGESE